ncbi:hypothetical protein ACFO1B_42465 [Dactylosporangium siamense]|uniref:CBU-0592-like domain-containing protein n=1 Tax=Dactylosporangium siamense TaxID=685454 RepID=A0A919PVT4_9ACTN|nr:hypothetical protein [Dactylosporangium siamense]GIG51089.1 hypothetical protein Dsi01nite_091300 [Dactylosporangium siamense]
MIALLGWAGAAVLLAAYALVSSKRITGDGGVFQVLNIVGGAALALNSAVNGAWPSAVLNVIWVAIGAVAMFRLARKRTRQSRPEYQGVLTR